MARFEEVYHGVREGIASESLTSEAVLSSVVTHEIATHLAGETNAPDAGDVAQISVQALRGVYDSGLVHNEFVGREAVRGIVHGLVAGGLSVSKVREIAHMGILHGLRSIGYAESDALAVARRGQDLAYGDLGSAVDWHGSAG